MFRSRRRPVVFPQAEHARLAGALALAWGNERFPLPALPFASFVAGVTLHDRGYGEHDADAIGEVETERWVAIQRAGFAPHGDDPAADLVIALHVRRLVSDARNPLEVAALHAMEAELPGLHAAAGLDERTAADADRITDLCDRLAFDFCFEQAHGANVEVPSGTVAYRVDGAGGIELDPWPLRVPSLTGIVMAYRVDGYPGRLDPVVVPFEVRARTPGRRHTPAVSDTDTSV